VIGTAAGVCLNHADTAATFTCRQCQDALCSRCRGDGERDLCRDCQQYFLRSGDAEAAGDARSTGRAVATSKAGRRLIAVLAIANLGLAGSLFVMSRQSATATRALGLEAVPVVKRAVEESRAETQRVPESIDALLPRMPAHVADLVRRGAIVYKVVEGGASYEVVVFIDPATGDRRP
jgi:hypothetical protein